MKIACCLFQFKSHGGLQKSFLSIVNAAVVAGHTVTVFTLKWDAELPKQFNVDIIPVSGVTNHQRCQRFIQALEAAQLQKHYDCVLGFNRMPGLDVYYAGDVCFLAEARQKHGLWYRFTPRYCRYAAWEKAVMENPTTAIFWISRQQQKVYEQHYTIEAQRSHQLPPGIDPQFTPPNDVTPYQQRLREQLRLPSGAKIISMIGSDFRRKGVDRVIKGLAALAENNVHLCIAGVGKKAPHVALAKRLKVYAQVHFLGGVSESKALLWGSHYLVHAATHEAAGSVILEAMMAGVPVLTTADSGFSAWVKQAKAGLVLPSPFSQKNFNHLLKVFLESHCTSIWRENALHFVASHDVSSRANTAVSFIERLVSDPRFRT